MFDITITNKHRQKNNIDIYVKGKRKIPVFKTDGKLSNLAEDIDKIIY